MLSFSQYVIVLEMAGILDMWASAPPGAADGPVDAALNLRSALKPLIRDNDVEFEGMSRCLVEMLLCKPDMFGELHDKHDTLLGLNRIMVRKIVNLIDPGLLDPSNEECSFKYSPPAQPADTSDAEKLEAAEQDAMQRFFQANAAFFTQIIVKKAAIRAAMLESPADFPGIKAPEAAPAAAGASPGAQSKSHPLRQI